MKNLNEFGVQEMNLKEIKIVNGGWWLSWFQYIPGSINLFPLQPGEYSHGEMV